MKDTELIGVLGQIENRLGQLAQGQDNAMQYLGSVSKKADDIRDALVAHKDNNDAHGASAAKGSIASVVVWIGLAFNLFGVLFIAYKIGGGHG